MVHSVCTLLNSLDHNNQHFNFNWYRHHPDITHHWSTQFGKLIPGIKLAESHSFPLLSTLRTGRNHSPMTGWLVGNFKFYTFRDLAFLPANWIKLTKYSYEYSVTSWIVVVASFSDYCDITSHHRMSGSGHQVIIAGLRLMWLLLLLVPGQTSFQVCYVCDEQRGQGQGE